MKKTRKGFGKKLLLAIHQDNSRGKEEKYQKRKKLGKNGNSPGQFQNVLEVKEGQTAATIKHEKNNDKNGQKKSRNACFRHFGNSPGQSIPEAKAEKTIKTNRNEKGRIKKNNLAMVWDNSKGKTRRNSQNDEQIRNKTGLKKTKMKLKKCKSKTRRIPSPSQPEINTTPNHQETSKK